MGYRGKVEQRQRARELRARSWTLQEIAAELGVSKSSVSIWVRDVEFVPRPRNRGHPAGPKHPMRVKRLAEIEALRSEAVEQVGSVSDRDVFVFGLALYLGEGAKTERSALRMTNTSADVMQAFMVWLRRFFEIDEERLRARLYLHHGLDVDAATRHWSDVLDIPASQFQRPFRPPTTSVATTKYPHGCITVIYSSLSLHRRVMTLMEAITSSIADPG